MESFVLERDIKLCCVPVTSFPAGIMEAHKKLRRLLPSTQGRKFFGVSYGNGGGGIVYKAGVEQLDDREAAELGCEQFTIKKGKYIGKILRHVKVDISSIMHAFQELLAEPRLDPDGCCVEMYLNEQNVRCMVRILTNE